MSAYIVFALNTSLELPEQMLLTAAILQAESEQEAANMAPSLGIAPPAVTEYHVCDLVTVHSFTVTMDTTVVVKEGVNLTEAFAPATESEPESVSDGE